MQQVYKILMNMCITSYPFISSGLYRLPGLQINFISILQGSDPPPTNKVPSTLSKFVWNYHVLHGMVATKFQAFVCPPYVASYVHQPT